MLAGLHGRASGGGEGAGGGVATSLLGAGILVQSERTRDSPRHGRGLSPCGAGRYLASGQMGSTSRWYVAWHSSAQDRYAASTATKRPR
jgi:hypothetical protein